LPKLLTDDINWARFIFTLRSDQFLHCTQEELANTVGVGGNTVSKWEQGRSEPGWKMKRKLKAFARDSEFSEDQWPRKDRSGNDRQKTSKDTI